MDEKTKLEVVIVDDDDDVLASFSDQIAVLGHYTKSFNNPTAAIEALEAGCGDVLLVDLCMPDLTGLDVQQRLVDLDRPLPVILISAQATIPATVQAIKEGAVEFLEKPVELEALRAALDLAASKLVGDRRDWEVRKNARRKFEKLTAREATVFEHLLTGATTKVIARQLGISDHTVTDHRNSVMKKLEVNSVAELIAVNLDLNRGS